MTGDVNMAIEQIKTALGTTSENVLPLIKEYLALTIKAIQVNNIMILIGGVVLIIIGIIVAYIGKKNKTTNKNDYVYKDDYIYYYLATIVCIIIAVGMIMCSIPRIINPEYINYNKLMFMGFWGSYYILIRRIN